MFSTEYMSEIREAFSAQISLMDEEIERLERESAGLEGLASLRLPLLREKKEEILNTLKGCSADEGEALQFLYSAMPFSDLVDYPAELFLSFARHGVFLWKEGPFAGKVPERLFANYVLHHRVNNEDLVDLRGFFYEKAGGSIVPGDMEKTVIEANYWCAGEGTYRSTDGRTQNARTMYSTATGRCGEESTFAITVLRSLGIPARQVYAPLWVHCDDNHAWVEAWCDGGWKFFGACEPEERLNYGWFIEPSSRAMLLHSRWFGPDEPLEPVLGTKGMSHVLNHMERYARTIPLTVCVEDEEGHPLPGSKVEFQVVNSGELRPIAFLRAAGDGTVSMITGYGDLFVTGSFDSGKEVLYGEERISLTGCEEGESREVSLVLHKEVELTDDFVEMEFCAPKPSHVNDDTLTPEQKETGILRNQKAEEHRDRKKALFYNEEKVNAVLKGFPEEEREELEEILHRSLGNLDQILEFLSWDSDCLKEQERFDLEADPKEQVFFPNPFEKGENRKRGSWKLEALRSLREKDLWDIRADILKECCENSAPFGGKIPGRVFYPFLVNPRVANEMVRKQRSFLADGMSEAEKEAIRLDPALLLKFTEQWIHSIPEKEYEDLVTSPLGCLRGGIGSTMSRKVFCVNLYRALGIPARIRILDGTVEYYQDGHFQGEEKKEVPTGKLTLRGSDSLKLTEWAHYSLDHFAGDHYEGVRLWDRFAELEKNQVQLDLEPGIYRALTSNRRHDGSQLVRMKTFRLEAGDSISLELTLGEISGGEQRKETSLPDLTFKTPSGESVHLGDLSGEGSALLIWLEVTREPTEHILNELIEDSEKFDSLTQPLYVVVKSPEDLLDPTLMGTRKAIPSLQVLYHDFGQEFQDLARAVDQKPDRLPFAVILKGGARAVYSGAGYNVGLADLLYRILGSEAL